MTPELKALIERLEELEKKATPGRWTYYGRLSSHICDQRISPLMDKNYQVAVSVDEFANTLELIAAARNALPLLLQIVKVQGECLNAVSTNGEGRGMGWTPAQHARIALATVDKLVKEGGE